MDDNLYLWNQVCETPDEHKSAIAGTDLDAVDPTFQLQRATELWGPYGEKWGIDQMKWTIDYTAGYMMLEGVFFYPDADQATRIEFPYAIDSRISSGEFGNTRYMITAFRSKCLSLLGFSADVHMDRNVDGSRGKALASMETLRSEAIAKIKAAKTEAELNECSERVDTLLEKHTINSALASELHDLIAGQQVHVK